ncbi:hypothetical protein GCM10011341_21690 [Frigidibacter albus]|nr:hypothetical protein GCM10011341_21690 [Frigidibacter albus]
MTRSPPAAGLSIRLGGADCTPPYTLISSCPAPAAVPLTAVPVTAAQIAAAKTAPRLP